ncbi:MAG: putative membrane protein YgcG [Paracoccaceae bacterium]|jgi:uncharacterized membrane protein YgcG
MPYLILGLAVLIGVYFVFRGLRGTNPRNLQKVLAIVVGIVAVTVLGFFAVSGRMGYFGWAMLLLPLVFRWRAISQAMRNMRGPTPGKNSDIETAYLRMKLEHDSGVLSGTVLQGQFEGRNLEELSFEDLLALLRECRVNDPQSATVLETYLDRVHGADWRGAGGGEAGGSSEAGGTAGAGGSMSRDQAYEVLGLEPGASEAQIRDAHRKLLMANHPDKGGSTFLAAQINQAKDVLLPGV